MAAFRKLVGALALTFPLASFGFCESYEAYVGLGIGPETANFKQKAFVIGQPPSTSFRVIDETHLAGKGGFGSLFGGLALKFPACDPHCDTFYLGVEANANFRNVKFESTNEEFINMTFNHTTYRMRRDFGISVLPGILLSKCTLFYARLGYANGRFSSNTTDTSLQNIHKNLNGFRYGLGFRQGINECFAFRIEYSQTNYQKAHMTTFDPVGNVRKSTAITPTLQRFELGIMYIF